MQLYRNLQKLTLMVALILCSALTSHLAADETNDYQTKSFPIAPGTAESFNLSFDLVGTSLVFINDGNGDFDICQYPAAGLPSPTSGTFLPPADDTVYQVDLTDGKLIPLFGGLHSSFFVSTNGFIDLSDNGSDFTDSVEEHFDQPRISAFWDDLNSNAGGSITHSQLDDRLVITWLEVPTISDSNSKNTFQVELYFDGRIRITWLEVFTSGRGITVGVSSGQTIPDPFTETDYSASGDCSSIGSFMIVDNLPIQFIDQVPTPDNTPVEFMVNNIGAGFIFPLVESNVPWVTGVVDIGATNRLALWDASSLSVGVTTGTLTISDSVALNSPITVPIEAIITERPPTLDVSPTSLTALISPTVGRGQPFTVSNIGGGELSYSVRTEISPSQLSYELIPESGSGVTFGNPATVDTSIFGSGLLPGVYQDEIIFDSPEATNSSVRVPVDITLVSAITIQEEFDQNFDLLNKSLTFTPNQSGGYDYCIFNANTFPTSPSQITTIPTNDSFIDVSLDQTFTFFGLEIDSLKIGANGVIDLRGGGTPIETNVSFGSLWGVQRVAGLLTRLDYTDHGSIAYEELNDRFVATWLDVKNAGPPVIEGEKNSSHNDFQIELFFDGRVRMTWINVDAESSIVALSSGIYIPQLSDKDFSDTTLCPAEIELSTEYISVEGEIAFETDPALVPEPVTFLITNAGGQDLEFNISTNFQPNELEIKGQAPSDDLFSVSPESGLIPGNQDASTTITVTFDTVDLPIGYYYNEIRVSSPDDSIQEQSLGVQLQVLSPFPIIDFETKMISSNALVGTKPDDVYITFYQNGNRPTELTFSSDASWLNLSAIPYPVMAGSAQYSIPFTFDDSVISLTTGNYQDSIRVTGNGIGEEGFIDIPISLNIVEDYGYAEIFSNDFDLEMMSMTITPIANQQYDFCVIPATKLQIDKSGGEVVPSSLDSSELVEFDEGFTFPFYGQNYDAVYMNSNGNITLGSSDTEYQFNENLHFRLPRISVFAQDLDTSTTDTSQLLFEQLPDRAVFTWDSIPNWQRPGTLNTFQAELFIDGQIRITWLDIEPANIIPVVGVSSGIGVPPAFIEEDFSTANECDLDPAQIVLDENYYLGTGANASGSFPAIPVPSFEFTVTNPGDFPLVYNVQAREAIFFEGEENGQKGFPDSTPVDWVSFSMDSGIIPPNAPGDSIEVQFDISNLPPVNIFFPYSLALEVSSEDTDITTKTIQLEIYVLEPYPVIQISQDEIFRTIHIDDANPTPEFISINNTGAVETNLFVSTNSTLYQNPVSLTNIPANSSSGESIEYQASVTTLLPGLYQDTVFVTGNGIGPEGTSSTKEIPATVQIVDQYGNGEEFNIGDFDLNNQSLTMIPTSASEFEFCVNPIAELPITEIGDARQTPFFIPDNLELSNEKLFPFYGKDWNSFYMDASGAITFTVDHYTNNALPSDFFEQRRIAILNDNGFGVTSGIRHFIQLEDRAVLTWSNVPINDDQLITGSFQAELFFDGTIRLSWLNINDPQNIMPIVGISSGAGDPLDPDEIDFSNEAVCGIPIISHNPTEIEFTLNISDGPSDATTFDISNTGSHFLDYSIEVSEPWMSVNPMIGTAFSETDSITINFNATGLDLGVHQGTVTINSLSAPNSPVVIPLTLTVIQDIDSDIWIFTGSDM